MSLINRHPSEEIELRSFNLPVARTLERFLCDVKKMSDEFFRGDLFGTDWTRATRWNPAVDISESSNSYLISAELPGFRKEHVNITLNNNVITIRGEKKTDEDKGGLNYRHNERQFGSFERSFILPGTVENGRIEASFNEDILTVTVPKTEALKETVIDVKIK